MVGITERIESVTARRTVPAVGLVMLAFVVFGFCVNAAVRLPCFDVCGSDIGHLYGDRGIDRAHAPYISRELEYPPLIGEVMYVSVAPFSHGDRNPFLVNAAILTALAAATTWMLSRRDGKRAWRWALAPPLLVQGLTNWDLLSVATATIGLIVWENGYAVSAGLLLGVGAAAKLYPALFVPILAATSLGRGRRREAVGVLGGSLVAFGAIVAPVYVVAVAHALRYLFEFHGDRGPDRGSIWYFVFHGPGTRSWFPDDAVVHIVGLLFVAIMAVAMLVLVTWAARGRISPITACALATIACLASSKIYSPQYDIWLVPFLVLLPVSRRLVLHFYAASLLVFALTASDDHFLHRPASGWLLGVAVVYRFVVLMLIATALSRREPDELEIDLRMPSASHHPARR